MAELLTTGKSRLQKIGFSSPNAGTDNVTMHQIAKAHKIKLPKKRADAEPILLRALAIVRIKQLESDASDKYEDTKAASKWSLNITATMNDWLQQTDLDCT